MEKKIERVPYISKWYKEEQKDELLHFAFDEQNAGSDFDVDKFSLYDKNLYTYSTNTTNGLWTTEYSKPKIQLKYNLTCAIQKYIENIDDIINKKQRQQLERLEKQYQPNQKLYCTLVEHWKELMDLFEIKSKHGLKSFKNIDENYLIIFSNDCDSTNKLYSVFNKLGIDFIKDFIKACEKCED